jgi:hypothetical protein
MAGRARTSLFAASLLLLLAGGVAQPDVWRADLSRWATMQWVVAGKPDPSSGVRWQDPDSVVLCSGLHPGTRIVHAASLALKDLTLSATLSTVGVSGEDAHDAMCLVVRDTGEQFLRFSADAMADEVALQHWDGHKVVTLISRPYPIEHATKYALRVKAEGERITAWINGEEVLRAQAPLTKPGNLGLASQSCYIRCYQLKVDSPERIPFAEIDRKVQESRRTVLPGAVRWGGYDILAEEPLVQDGRAEIVTEVANDATGAARARALPVRVIVRASDDTHPDGSGRGVYADGRFFAEGRFVVSVPPGPSKIELRSGPDYVPLELGLKARAGKSLRVCARLCRWFSPEQRGWYGGDNHVHAAHEVKADVRASLDYAALQARANGLSFVTEAGSYVSYADIGRLNTDAFLLRHAAEAGGACFVGHLNTPGITQQIPLERYWELYRRPLPTQAIVQAVHDLGGAAIYTHPLSPPQSQIHWMAATELFSDAVLGNCADAFDIDSRATELLWFAALNLGNRLACSSYTDCSLNRLGTLSPGDRRVYCHARELTYPEIVAALRHGNTMATNGGPVFPFFTIDGREPGDTIAPRSGESCAGRLEIRSLYRLRSAEIYRNGNVARTFDVAGRGGEVVLTHPLSEQDKCWYLARVEDEHGNWAITSPIYFEPPAPAARPSGYALLLQISSTAQASKPQRDFFAHLIVTVSPRDPLQEVLLVKDGEALHRFTTQDGNHMPSGRTPVTDCEADYEPGWLWYPAAGKAAHFQADWPVTEAGWYELRAVTASGRTLVSDAFHLELDNPNSSARYVAHLVGPGASLALWGYGELGPASDSQPSAQDMHPGYPRNSFWRLRATFDGTKHELTGGRTQQPASKFREHLLLTSPAEPSVR